MIVVNRSGADLHLLALRDLSQQLSASAANLAIQHLTPYFVVHTR
jgi:hypothetical protein